MTSKIHAYASPDGSAFLRILIEVSCDVPSVSSANSPTSLAISSLRYLPDGMVPMAGRNGLSSRRLAGHSESTRHARYRPWAFRVWPL